MSGLAASERRVVSVLFADLVGFTTLSERLDAEDVATIQDRYFALAREAVESRLGTVEKFIGDAVVGVFGLPRAGDDDAERAVGAAIEVVQGVRRLSTELALTPPGLSVRVGVNTGEVVVTFTDAERSAWRLTGDTVNVAARLQASAEPAQVLVGPHTSLAVAEAFETEPLGPLILKGKSEELPTSRVVRARTVPSRAQVMPGLVAPTLGRDRELAMLERSWSDAVGRTQGWLVVAPPGAGKSRLVAEFTSRIRGHGGLVLATRVGSAGDEGYGPVTRLLEASIALVHDGDGSQLDRLVARLERRGYAGPRAEVGARHVLGLLGGDRLDAEPLDLFTSWTAVLDSVDGAGPCVWVVEDVHRGGPDLLAFLRHAMSTPSDTGRVVLMTARPAVSRALDEGGLGDVGVLHLEPLGRDTASDLVEALVGPGVVPAPLAGSIADASGGNPLFVEELLRAWVQCGVLRCTNEGRWELAGPEELPHVPTTVQAVYHAQLDALPRTSRAVVSTGSVPGTTFPAGAIPALGVRDAEGPLDDLAGLGLLVGPHRDALDEQSYTYRHGLLRDVAYGSLPRAERARLHRLFARWVDAVAGDRADDLAGSHLAAACELAPALAAGKGAESDQAALAAEATLRLERAAVTAMASEPLRAASLLGRALALSPGEGPDMLRRRFRLAEALRRAGRLEDAMRTFAEAGDLASELDDAATLAEAAFGYENALFASRLPRPTWGAQGVDLLTRALAVAPPGGRARLLAALGRASAYSGDAGQAAASCAEAVRLAREAEDDGALAYALLAVRATQESPGHLVERLSGATELAEAARRCGDHETEFEGVRLAMVDHLTAGDVAAADVAQRRAERLAETLKRPLYLWYPPMWTAMRALLAGDLRAAERHIEGFREQGERWSYGDVALVHAVQLLHLSVERGQPSPGLAAVERVAAADPARWAMVLAYGYAQADRLDEARRHLDVLASTGFDGLPRDLSFAYNVTLAASAAASLHDVTASGALLVLLEPWLEQTVVLGSGAVCLGAVSHFAGLAARTAGDVPRSTRLFAHAVHLNEVIGAAPAAARSREELARTQRPPGRGRSRDSD